VSGEEVVGVDVAVTERSCDGKGAGRGRTEISVTTGVRLAIVVEAIAKLPTLEQNPCMSARLEGSEEVAVLTNALQVLRALSKIVGAHVPGGG
jgi:hypothetical protein